MPQRSKRDWRQTDCLRSSLVVMVQLLSSVLLFATPWTTAHQAYLSSTISQNLLKFLSILGERNGNPLQYSCLETPVDRGAWRAVVPRVAQSRTRLKRLGMHACIGEGNGNPLVFLPGESQGQRSLVGCHLWGCIELDTTEVT